jgi:hypothetical protein
MARWRIDARALPLPVAGSRESNDPLGWTPRLMVRLIDSAHHYAVFVYLA